MIGGSCSWWRRGAHGVAVRGDSDAVVVMASDAAGLRAWQCPGRRQVLSPRGRARGGGPARTGPAAAQVRPAEAMPGDSRVRRRGDRVERVMQRRGVRPGSAGSVPPITPSWNIAKQRISSARDRRRRSKPRTVAGGTSRSAPIRAYPAPLSAAARPVPITSTASARRGAHQDRSRMCVRWQDRQRARSGRSHAVAPPSSRITRSRPCPHWASLPVPHDGQASRPPARSAEAAAASAHSSTAGLPEHDGHDARARAPRARGSSCCSLPGPAASRNPDRPGRQQTTQ